MSESGGYAIAHRRSWTHPIFKNRQEASVWIWLYTDANWREEPFEGHCFGKPFSVGRGEIVISEREIAEEHGLDRAVVRRLMKHMAAAGMIEMDRERCDHRIGTIVRIVNYERYQRLGFDLQPPIENPSRNHARANSRTHTQYDKDVYNHEVDCEFSLEAPIDEPEENPAQTTNAPNIYNDKTSNTVNTDPPPTPHQGVSAGEESNVVFLRSTLNVQAKAEEPIPENRFAPKGDALLPGFDLDPAPATPKKRPTASATSKPSATKEMLYEAEAIWNRHASECGLATSRGMKSNREKLVRDRLVGDCGSDLRKWEEFVLACVGDQWLNETNQTLDYVCAPRNFDRILDKADARKRNAGKPAFNTKKQANGKAAVGSGQTQVV